MVKVGTLGLIPLAWVPKAAILEGHRAQWTRVKQTQVNGAKASILLSLPSPP